MACGLSFPPERERMSPFTKEEPKKKCFRKGCDNKRGERGLYCSAECHSIDYHKRNKRND